MSLRVIAPGPLSTIQDGGRYGFRSFGVPVSGPFDRRSAAIANALAGNRPGSPVVELTGFGGVFEAEHELAIALAGAPMLASIEKRGGSQRVLVLPCVTQLRDGDRLELGKPVTGYRTYLAVSGGWHSPEIMGSRSDENRLVAGRSLVAASTVSPERRTECGRIGVDGGPIRYVQGPDAEEFAAGSLRASSFLVRPDSDRMGVRLGGAKIEGRSSTDRISIPVAPGVIQVAGGLPIVLGPACGTMGGYPCIGVVLSEDMDRIGQMRPSSPVQFEPVGQEEARRIDRAYRSSLAALVMRLAAAVG